MTPFSDSEGRHGPCSKTHVSRQVARIGQFDISEGVGKNPFLGVISCCFLLYLFLFDSLPIDPVNATLLAGGSFTTDVSNLSAFLTGMEDIESDYASFPIGWRGPVGQIAQQNSTILLRVVRPIVQSKLGYTDDEYDQMVQQIAKEWSQYKTWANAYYAYAKKGDGSVP